MMDSMGRLDAFSVRPRLEFCCVCWVKFHYAGRPEKYDGSPVCCSLCEDIHNIIERTLCDVDTARKKWVAVKEHELEEILKKRGGVY